MFSRNGAVSSSPSVKTCRLGIVEMRVRYSLLSGSMTRNGMPRR